MHEIHEIIPHARAQVGIVLVVPLQEPGHQLDHAGEQRHQAFGGPAIAVLALLVIGGDRQGALEMVVAGPGDDEAAIGIALAVRERDEALLRHIEAAAQTPKIRALKILGDVFRRHGNVADLFALASALLLCDQPVDLLFHGRCRARLHADRVGLGFFAGAARIDGLPLLLRATLGLGAERIAPRRHLGIDRVFAPLLIPGGFPLRPLAQAGFGVAQGGEEGHGFLATSSATRASRLTSVRPA